MLQHLLLWPQYVICCKMQNGGSRCLLQLLQPNTVKYSRDGSCMLSS